MPTREEILEYADTLHRLEQLDVVKEYTKALHEVVAYSQTQNNKQLEYYKSSKKYDYYIESPYEEFIPLNNGKYGFRQNGYSYCGKGIGNHKGWSRSGCVSLRNYTKSEIKNMIDQSIERDNEEVEKDAE